MFEDISANDRQVAGDHYRKGDKQHWDWVAANNISYLGGQTTKYVSRWQSKNGVVDLKKADHFLEKMLEVHEQQPTSNSCTVHHFLESQGIGDQERVIILLVDLYERNLDKEVLVLARRLLAGLIEAKSPA